MAAIPIPLFLSIILFFSTTSSSASHGHGHSSLRLDFYKHSCPHLQRIVHERVADYSHIDDTTPSPLLRLFFHDCFVQGCDASVLLNSSSSSAAEKQADINFSLDRFDVINEIKSLVESSCPGVVSCADILALTAVYSVHQAGGPLYKIELGRRDGLTSYDSSAQTFLPAPTLTVDGLLQNFEIVGLNKVDLVVLSGAHTIGQGHCRSVKNRLYPTVDSAYHKGYGKELLKNCTHHWNSTEVQIFNDARTHVKFDNGYFKGLKQGYGLFTSDNVLYEDARTRSLVNLYAGNQTEFFRQFGVSLRRMGKIGVLTGTQGEIRSKCWIRNSDNADSALDPAV